MLGSGLVRTKVKTGRDFRRNDTPPNYPAGQVSVKRVPFSSRCPAPGVLGCYKLAASADV